MFEEKETTYNFNNNIIIIIYNNNVQDAVYKMVRINLTKNISNESNEMWLKALEYSQKICRKSNLYEP